MGRDWIRSAVPGAAAPRQLLGRQLHAEQDFYTVRVRVVVEDAIHNRRHDSVGNSRRGRRSMGTRGLVRLNTINLGRAIEAHGGNI